MAAGFASQQQPIPEHLLQEVKLCRSSAEREKFDNLAAVYEILLTLEHIERAYVHDNIGEAEYTETCKKLLTRFKACRNLLPSDVANDIPAFAATYRLECPAALQRIRVGVPATTEFGSGPSADHVKRSRHVMAATEHFISITDTFSMDIGDVDKLHNEVSGLMDQLNKLDDLSPDHISKRNVLKWLEVLSAMKATDALSPEQIREALMDFDMAYDAYKRQIWDN
ncbi:uncharacterized protein MONBRDRAFT_32007 [Monosiga brevicollis MX1]|uniref:Vacuolar protein sorting-associated protein 28 homolog n=1 Tax=Monosiga brevicollis TaxID=81824 RepID=A9UWU0_MONBE|nr:uncharacterized protein MONBRDRAFT_32007 [Monosiga brevicollis MX1]EDQ90275.1 predicted protein [Monosiga brevicollis MX1]|eukprot:XP_001745042.1 hypothetical protein [Monosiga brevicollis MX1]